MDQSQEASGTIRQKKTQDDVEKEVLLDLAKIQGSLGGKSSVEALQIVLSRYSQKTEVEESKRKYLDLFHSVLSKFNADKIIDVIIQLCQDALSKLDDEDTLLFFDYVNYSFELLGRGVKLDGTHGSYNPSYLLKVFNYYVAHRGTNGIIEGVSQKKSLTTQVITIK